MTTFDSLRDFLAHLEFNGQLLTVREQVSPEPDLGAAARALSDLGEDTPALLFDNIHGYDGARVALNVHGSWPNHALMMGMDKHTPSKEQFFEFVRRYEAFPGRVDYRAEAPWQECVIDDPARINLFELLPLFRLNRHDAGCFIDKAVVVSREPDRPDDVERQNVGIYRLQVKGPSVVRTCAWRSQSATTPSSPASRRCRSSTISLSTKWQVHCAASPTRWCIRHGPGSTFLGEPRWCSKA
jgi:4-hydroxybenzoate decarboxylase